MQILHILSFYLYICVYSFKYLQILHIGVIAMKNKNRQTLPLGRSTKEDNAGLSLPTSNYNSIATNKEKSSFSFFNRLVSKKFLSDEQSLIRSFRLHYSGHVFKFLQIQVWYGHFTIPKPTSPFIFYSTRLIHL